MERGRQQEEFNPCLLNKSDRSVELGKASEEVVPISQ